MDSKSKTIELIKSTRVRPRKLARRTRLTPTALNCRPNGCIISIRPSNVEAVAKGLSKQVIFEKNVRSKYEFRNFPDFTRPQ